MYETGKQKRLLEDEKQPRQVQNEKSKTQLATVVNFNVLVNSAPKKLTFESLRVLPVSEVPMFPLRSELSYLIL